jgi:6-pyruvoyltetrahydropterin/6-carboxytetrahydropterin synthase
MTNYQSTKLIELGSCAFRQPSAVSRCKLCHGYQLKAKFWFGAAELDDRNWVVDFGGLKDLKAILQNQFDHKLVIAGNDPLLPLFRELHEKGGCDLVVMENGVGIERFAEFCFNTADAYIRDLTYGRCWVTKVEVFEHEANSAIYTPSR